MVTSDNTNDSWPTYPQDISCLIDTAFGELVPKPLTYLTSLRMKIVPILHIRDHSQQYKWTNYIRNRPRIISICSEDIFYLRLKKNTLFYSLPAINIWAIGNNMYTCACIYTQTHIYAHAENNFINSTKGKRFKTISRLIFFFPSFLKYCVKKLNKTL